MDIKSTKWNLIRIVLFVILTIFLSPQKAKSQASDSLSKKIEGIENYLLYRNHDTTYINNFGNEIAVRLVAVTKYNSFHIRDRINKSSIKYRPLRDLSLGAGFSYKVLAIDLTFSLGLNNTSEFENTRSFDFQATVFTSKQYISASLQYYQAYTLANIKGVDINISEAAKRREDIRTINFGLQYQYAFNYTRFSMKAPFVFNEIQVKSAGSPMIGAGFNMFVLDSDSSIIPDEAAAFFVPNANLNDLNILSVSMSFGYMYTFVYRKHFFLTLSLILGFNVNAGDYYTDQRNYIDLNVNLKFNSMNAIGYNGRKLYVGINFLTNSYLSRLDKKLYAQIGHGRAKLFIGYRFGKK
jgi:hypothetical protein